MDRDESSASWLDDALEAHPQDLTGLPWENEALQGKMEDDPISLFGRFVSAVSLDTSAHIETQSRFLVFVRDLCIKAPSVAKYLSQQILDHEEVGSQPEVQTTKRSSKRKKKADPIYRGPKIPQSQIEILKERLREPHEASSSSNSTPSGDELVTCATSYEDTTANQSKSNGNHVMDQPLLALETNASDVAATKEAAVEGVVPQGGQFLVDSNLSPSPIVNTSSYTPLLTSVQESLRARVPRADCLHQRLLCYKA